MNAITKIFNWKVTLLSSAIILILLVVLDFYGVYTNSFYILKPDNYIFPLLSTVHFVYLYVVWFKIREYELPDPKMRNIEFTLYAILLVYFYKIYDSYQILVSVSDYDEHVIPATFKPIAILTLVLYCLLPLLTFYTFWLRRKYVGVYNFENYNDNLNIWQ
ncbi:MAG: hypothetical protein ABGX00_11500 [Allomuricauda sp.]